MYSKKILSAICFSVLLLFPYIPVYSITPYVWSDSSNLVETTSANNSTDLRLQSDGAILIEQSTGQVLYEQNSHEMYRPASVTKVMSLLLIMEAIDKRSNFAIRFCSMFGSCCFYGWITNLAE